MMLKEYLEDYVLEDIKKKGEEVIRNEILNILNEKVRKVVLEYFEDLNEGKCDFRF